MGEVRFRICNKESKANGKCMAGEINSYWVMLKRGISENHFEDAANSLNIIFKISLKIISKCFVTE